MNKQSRKMKEEESIQTQKQGNCDTSFLLKPQLLTGFHSRGNLPHIKVEGATYWVTFRLHDSLPQKVLRKLAEEKKEWEIEQQTKNLSK